MSKIRAALVAALVAATLSGGAIAASATTDAGKAPITNRNGGDSWCC